MGSEVQAPSALITEPSSINLSPTTGLTAPRGGVGRWAPLYMGALWLSFLSFSDSPLSAQEISLIFLPGS